MLFRLVSFFFLCAFVYGNQPEYTLPVNLLTGQLELSAIDLVAPGTEPLELKRVYTPPLLPKFFSSRDPNRRPTNKDKESDRTQLMAKLKKEYRGWEFYPHLRLKIHENSIQVADKNGVALCFEITEKSKTATLDTAHRGFNNMQGDRPHPSHDLRNMKCVIRNETNIHIICPDGTILYYILYKTNGKTKEYLLSNEKLPNGRLIHYEYGGKGALVKVSSHSPDGETIYAEIFVDNEDFVTHLGQKASYQYETHDKGVKLLSSIHTPLYQENFGYCPRALLCWQNGGSSNFSVTYSASDYEDTLRISEFLLPVGPNKEREVTHRFHYNLPEKTTRVTHPDGRETLYQFSDESFLIKVTDREEKHYEWEEGLLKAIEVKGVYRKEYTYDQKGNPIKETLNGNYSIYRKFSDDHLHLLLNEKHDDGLTITYSYLPETNLLQEKITKGIDGTTLYEYREYDNHHNLIRTNITNLEEHREEIVHSDPTPPSEVTFTYDELGHLLFAKNGNTWIKRTIDPFGNVLREEFSTGVFLEKDYDDKNRPIKLIFPNSTTIDYEYDLLDLKKVTRSSYVYTYDSPPEPLSLDEPSSSSHNANEEFSLTYDRLNRLIEAKSPTKTILFTYDALGRCLSKSVNDAIKYYLYDGLEEIASFDASFYLRQLKIEGAFHQPVAIELHGEIFSVALDTQGNVHYLIDP